MAKAIKVDGFDAALATWLERAQAQIVENTTKNYTNVKPSVLSLQEGPCYVKVVSNDSSGSRSAFCFICKATGNVLKAASWKAPAKGPRGSIFGDNLGVGPYGAHYAR